MSDQYLIEIFNQWRNPSPNRAYPVIEAIPDDAVVVGAQHDFGSSQLLVLVQSESFDVVPEGSDIPRFPGNVEWKSVEETPKWRGISAAIDQEIRDNLLNGTWIAEPGKPLKVEAKDKSDPVTEFFFGKPKNP